MRDLLGEDKGKQEQVRTGRALHDTAGLTPTMGGRKETLVRLGENIGLAGGEPEHRACP